MTATGKGRDAAERFQKLEKIFHRASELGGEALDQYLEDACEGDAELRREVANILGVADGAEERLDAVVGAGVAQVTAGGSPEIPERVGVYKILDRLGEGGLGAVYLAERADDEFHKRVAIKWLRPELVSAELERRFRIERQVLASLEHPYIARILDGGTHEGAAYLVMELVEGQHLLEHCREFNLGLEEKLVLFRKICEAVHHAHQGLILHCDLKPSNILVDGSGTPKLVDFGIAKALGNPFEAGGLLAANQATAGTLSGFRPLTPDYASPEQARFESLTTSSDIYSLGVVLYELLSGERPYRITTANPLEIAEAITSARVPRPSSKVGDGAEPAWRWWRRRAPWSSDLDAIVAKALRQEPEQRYGSVAQLSQDILSYLENRPVTARRGTWLYQGTKLVRRHRLGAAALATVLLSLSLSTVLTSRQARVAQRERLRAEQSLIVAEEEKDRAETVIDLLVGLFEFSHPEQALGEELTAREVLDQGSRRVQEQLKDRPKLRAALAGTLGRVYRELAILDQAELHLKDSLETRLEVLGATSPERVEALFQMALLRLDQQRLEPARRLLEEALQLEGEARGTQSSTYGELQRAMGLCLLEEGQVDAARAILVDYLSDPARSGGPHSITRAEGEDLLSRIAYEEGQAAEAEELAARSLEIRREVLGDEHPKVAMSLNNLVVIRRSRGDLDGARADLELSLEIRRKIYGDMHGAVAQSLKNLAVIHSQQRDFALAEKRLDEAESILLAIYGPDHILLADLYFSRARNGERQRSLEDAATWHRRALAIRRLKLSPDHPSIAVSLVGVANALRESDVETAEAHYQEALDMQRARPDLHGSRIARTLEMYGELRCKTDPPAGVELLKEALERRRENASREAWYTPLNEARLGRCLARIDRAQGLDLLRRAMHHLETELGAEDVITERARGWLAEAMTDP